VNIIFDLDGTLIDSKQRLYSLFKRLAPSSSLSYGQYWEFKHKRISNETILKRELAYEDDEVIAFVKEWMRLIETPEFLKLDVNFQGMHETLLRLKEHADLHVCTARQLREPVVGQLDRLNLLPYFRTIMVTEQKHSKESLIAAHVLNLGAGDWMVGDTGKDIQVGKLLNMKTCAVLSGFLSRESLLDYEPNLILDSAVDFKLMF
jgi:phosphoglycolate phosphatase